MDSEEVCLAARRPPLRLGSIARRRLATSAGAMRDREGTRADDWPSVNHGDKKRTKSRPTYLLTCLLPYQQQAPWASLARASTWAPCWHLNARLRTRLASLSCENVSRARARRRHVIAERRQAGRSCGPGAPDRLANGDGGRRRSPSAAGTPAALPVLLRLSRLRHEPAGVWLAPDASAVRPASGQPVLLAGSPQP